MFPTLDPELIRDPGKIPTAHDNPGRILSYVDQTAIPIMVHGHAYLVAVLKAGRAGDVAVYRALVPLAQMEAAHADPTERLAVLRWICRNGAKLHEDDARAVFPFLDQAGDYRP